MKTIALTFVLSIVLCGCHPGSSAQGNGATAESFPRHTIYHKTIDHEGRKYIVWQGMECIAVIPHPDDKGSE